jgi:hypothetical protein
MRQTKSKCKASELSDLLKIAALATLLLACLAAGFAAQQKKPENILVPGRSEQSFCRHIAEQRRKSDAGDSRAGRQADRVFG